ncbi:asparagine synthase-related protein [Streptomyces sp. NPDC001404]|uniref:asparagine synthase-related protein n=1 Tax=Streptomyces sp. NPDC001404 TaxID=3364571 RepID=UPI0036976E4C
MREGIVHWFAVVPDCAAARGVPERLSGAEVLASHASGRPWLIGRVPAGQCTVLAEGDQRLAVLGHHPGTADQLAQLAGRMRRPGDVTAPTGVLPGSAHLVVSVGGHVRVQGTASGLRRVYRATWRGMTVAADRADVLAQLTGAELDDGWLSASLLTTELPHPLNNLSAWRRIEAVAPGSALLITPDGRARIHRWWQPPAPVQPLAEGAPALREALSAAVSARADSLGAGQPLGSDLSGGLDSASLCFLAHRAQRPLVTMTVQFRAPGNDDAVWADRAAHDLPHATRITLPRQQLPMQYTALEHEPPGTDAPSLLLRTRALLDACAQQYVRHQVEVQLAGHGGDEVLQVPPGYLRDLLRRRPLLALRHARGHRVQYRWPLNPLLRGLADRRTYARWLADEAQLLHSPNRASLPLGWGPPLRLAPWALPRAVQAVASLLHEAASQAEPLAPGRGQHQALQRVHSAGQHYRLMRQELTEPWITLPFLDDQVLEACLAVRLEERGTPWRYKPLLAGALNGIVPPALLARTTKACGDADFYQGMREHCRELLDFVDNSRLARRGLIDPAPLRRALLAPSSRTVNALENTLAVESWLTRRPDTA